MRAPLDLTRTRAALASYDAAGVAVDTATSESAAQVIAAWDSALVAVGEAFATDTADRNRSEDCMPHAHQSHILEFIRHTASNIPAAREERATRK